MIRSLALLATLVPLIIFVGLIFIPWTLITGNVVPLYHATNWLVRTAYRVAGIHIAVEGREHVPARTACIFMANHVSNLDPQALIPEIPGRTSAFLKRSLMKIPIVGYGFRLGEFIPVERSGNAASAQESVAAARALLDKGVHITTFVEGTRSRDGRLLPFKKGPFYLAMQTGAPCIPVSIYGTETMLAKGSLRVKPGTAHIVFHTPLNPSDYSTRDELSQAVRAAIASGLPEWMRN
ncbi:MAG: lysophospholipid acyltransferase family protein [Terracidiphilus sp.]|jgi:1-acyl-sn-glycerol-3-phosphate acyltransferase